jgi:hypothetical protein
MYYAGQRFRRAEQPEELELLNTALGDDRDEIVVTLKPNKNRVRLELPSYTELTKADAQQLIEALQQAVDALT